MATLSIPGVAAERRTAPREAVEAFEAMLDGSLIRPGDGAYDDAIRIWNGMIKKRPSMVVRPSGTTGVIQTVNFARDHGLELSIKGGGHNIAGLALSDGGITLDMSGLRSVSVEVRARRATAEAGCILGDLDRATQHHGLATALGFVSLTGLAGLTLGGGFGYLSRRFGWTVDDLEEVEIVTADGIARRASRTEHADLFWAIRGGGGNFGAVTQFEFQLFPVGPEIFAGLMVFPFNQAKQILSKYRQFVNSAPEELNVWVVLRKAPPLPFLPENVHGKEVVILPIFYSGAVAEAEKLIAPVRAFGDAHGEHLGAQPYVAWQKAFDPLLTPGARNYWKSHNFTQLADGAVDSIIEFAGKLPSPQCEIFIGMIAGAPNRIAPGAMAYGHRDAKFVLNVHGRWDEAKDDQQCIGWARNFFKASAPYASAGAYVNFMTAEEGDRVVAAYGSNYGRLVQIKNRYDPDNIFHLNQNIKP